jgi:UDP-N-acetylglucosamine 2-epimerase (non-hydrolysing)
LVAGDGDAAVACALAAIRLGVPVARVGAGLRCGDRSLGEEINRIVLDNLADRVYADGEEAVRHLLDEGVTEDRIRCVGNTLPDAVQRWAAAARGRRYWHELGLTPGQYVLVSLHRRENLGDERHLAQIAEALVQLTHRFPLVLCVNPGARARMTSTGALRRLSYAGAAITGPLDYLDFLSLEAAAGAVVTDSAGVQEETSVLGVTCFTLRRASERTATLMYGTNTLLGDDPAALASVVIGPPPLLPAPIPYWDGAAGARIAADLRVWSGA